MIGSNRDDGKLRLTCLGGPFHNKELLSSLQGSSLTIRVGEQIGKYCRHESYKFLLQWIPFNAKSI